MGSQTHKATPAPLAGKDLLGATAGLAGKRAISIDALAAGDRRAAAERFRLVRVVG
jgi:hypothetical protein